MKKTTLLGFLCFISMTCIWAQEKYPKQENIHRIMSYNIHAGQGMDGKLDLERIADVINNVCPDIVAIQEADSVTLRGHGIDMMDVLGRHTLMHSVFAPAKLLEGGKYGIGILSKEKPIKAEQILLPSTGEQRVLLMVEFEKYIFFASHFSLFKEDRIESAKIISSEAAKHNKPVLLAGDINAEPNSETMKVFEKDWKLLSGDKTSTYPSDKPEMVIDYIMGYSGNDHIYATMQASVVDEQMASDHRPLFVDVRLAADEKNIMRTVPYLQNPATNEITVMWHTNVPTYGWVEYGVDSTNMQRVRTMNEGMNIANTESHRVHITGLDAGTKYYYRVYSQETLRYEAYYKEFGNTAKTQLHSFSTFDDDDNDFTAIIFNDLHEVYSTMDLLSEQVKDIDYDFVIYNGDCLSDIQTRDQVLTSLNSYTKSMDGSNIPAMYVRGNHEIRGGYSNQLWDVVAKMFAEHSYGAFSYGNTRFVILDCGEDKPDDFWVYYGLNDFAKYRTNQLEFIKQELKSKEFKDAKKRILIHHIPFFGSNQDKYNPSKGLWESELAKGLFNVSLNAHTHQFEYIPKGKENNIYPVVIGGEQFEEGATVMVLERKKNKLRLEVLNTKGDKLLSLDL